MDKDGSLTLTDDGIALAEKVFERHTIVTAALKALGVSEETAAEDACKIEHIISDESFNAIKEHLEKMKK